MVDFRLIELHERTKGRVLTCREISEGIGGALTLQRIHQIEREAMRKIYQRFREDPEVAFLFKP